MFACTASYSTLANHEREQAAALSWPSLCRYRLSTDLSAATRVDNPDQHCILQRHYLLASMGFDVGAPRREIYIPWLGARSRCCRSLASSSHSLPSSLLRRRFVDRSVSFHHRAVDQPGLLPVNCLCIYFLLIVLVPVPRQLPQARIPSIHS